MTRLAVAVLWLLHFLPLGALAAVGNTLGRLAFWLIPERRHVTRVNLRKCFPQMAPEARERLARAHFRAVTRSLLEHTLLWWAPEARLRRLIRLEGLEHLAALREAPVILLVPHFVGLDASGTRLALEINAVAIYSAQKNAVFNRLFAHGRGRFGDQRQVSRQEGVRVAIRSMLREKRPFFYLPDQDYGPRDALFVPFFGVAAATIPGLSRIAQLTRAKVVPVVARMLPGGAGYVVRLEPPWENFPSGDHYADTRRMNEYIEQQVLDMPEQYLWMHKRFKTRPPGEAGFY
ncbi:MAG TPA: lipid A biosynthesis acyltransferase [Burkholderiales bacterium]|jgi:KDO2-lipid IV(A) lauroyltransferase|nr:lipid A biosynthesis acyltransferase [Burkholderiales bacterium]